MTILFAGRPIACEMGVLKVFIVTILFASGPIACEMGVFQDFVVDLLPYCLTAYNENFICQQALCL